MHEKEVKAQEWLDSLSKEPTMKQIEKFAGADIELKTILVCLLDPDQKNVYEKRKNKNELTNRTHRESFEYWLGHPEWFFVFVPKDVVTLQFMYATQAGDDFELVEELMDDGKYIENLVEYGVFEPVILFKAIIDCGASNPREFLASVQEQIENFSDVKLEETSLNKFKFFKLDTIIEPDKDFIRREYKRFDESFEKFRDVLDIFEIEDAQNDPDEIFKQFMPRTLNMRGQFSMNSKGNYIGYDFDQNFSSILEDKLRAETKLVQERKEEKIKKKAELAFSVAKFGLTFAEKVFPPLGAYSMIKEAGELLGQIDNLREVKSRAGDVAYLTKGNFEHQRTGEPVLIDLVNDFKNSGASNFKDYFIKDLKFHVETGIKRQYPSWVCHLDEEIFNDIYKHFYRENVVQVLGDSYGDFMKEYKDSPDLDFVMVQAVLNLGAKTIGKRKVGDQWNF